MSDGATPDDRFTLRHTLPADLLPRPQGISVHSRGVNPVIKFLHQHGEGTHNAR